jgi:hypothetical protein
MRANGSTHLVITVIITVFSRFHVSRALAGQANPLIKVMSGYGFTDGAVAPLSFDLPAGWSGVFLFQVDVCDSVGYRL